MSRSNPLILAIDNGTQSVRALLFDLAGELAGKCQIEIEPWFSDQPGWAEQWPDYYWREIGRACHGLWTDGHDPGQVAGLTVTTQRGTQICLDEDGQPLRPAITWVDQRRLEASELAPMPWHWRALIAASGRAAALEGVRVQAECNWIARHQPDIWARTAHFVQLSGYLNYRLTGRLVDSVGSQVGYLPFDYKQQAWAGPRSWHWPALEVRREQLPELVAPGTPIGGLGTDAAAHLGLPAGLPVVASGGDKACELLGSGVSDEAIGCVSFGTRATISVHSRRYFEAVGRMPAFPAALPGYYMVEAAVPRGFWMVSWFKREFGLEERRLAEELGVSPESLFDRLVEQVPPGAMGLMLQPYWGRDIVPGPEAKGAIIGFGEVHTRAHLYRAILEGIVYGLREGGDAIERRGGRKLTALRVSGGGSQSDAAMQISADVFGLPAERPHTFETSGLGAAVVAAIGLGLFPDFEQAMRAMTRPGQRFEPDPATRPVYDELYRRVYRRLYPRLAPLYRAIREITAYPP
ncbi:MAG: FGGY-family carbohydrate kinase [Wenzhouxiangellaceae bacterium]